MQIAQPECGVYLKNRVREYSHADPCRENHTAPGEASCKICGAESLTVFAHTAKCSNCGVLLYYPYTHDSNLASWSGEKPRKLALDWYSKSSFYNHSNFTDMIRFAMDDSCKGRSINVLDYGGGGGQFALVCKSHFPQATVFITDVCDGALLDEWRSLNVQIPFAYFPSDDTTFDYIFLNDVFEHVSDPLSVLNRLAGKLKPGGNIFIDTPKQFWIYPLTKWLCTSLYTKVLKGTVSKAHLQIWTKRSFEMAVRGSGLRVTKYEESSEYTMPADYYLRNMAVTNPLVQAAGRIFYANAKWLAKNKIYACCQR